jgi:hypothetical protein
MQCVLCQQSADRSCTRCGHFFCPAHGGEREVFEGAGLEMHVATRVVCDKCAPDPTAVERFRKETGLVPILLVVMVAVVFAAALLIIILM